MLLLSNQFSGISPMPNVFLNILENIDFCRKCPFHIDTDTIWTVQQNHGNKIEAS